MQAATARPAKVFTAARPGTATCRRRGQRTAASAASPRSQLDGELEPPPPTRRQTLASAAALFTAATVAATAPEAQAVIKGYEPMPQLEGKDYGKPRMT